MNACQRAPGPRIFVLDDVLFYALYDQCTNGCGNSSSILPCFPARNGSMMDRSEGTDSNGKVTCSGEFVHDAPMISLHLLIHLRALVGLVIHTLVELTTELSCLIVGDHQEVGGSIVIVSERLRNRSLELRFDLYMCMMFCNNESQFGTQSDSNQPLIATLMRFMKHD